MAPPHAAEDPGPAGPACRFDAKASKFVEPNAPFCSAFCYPRKEFNPERTVATRSLFVLQTAGSWLRDAFDQALEHTTSTAEASKSFKAKLQASVTALYRKQRDLRAQIVAHDLASQAHRAKLLELKKLSKTPQYNNPNNPRGSLDDDRRKIFDLSLARSSALAVKSRKALGEIEDIQKRLNLYKNFLDQLDPTNQVLSLEKAIQSLDLVVEHLTPPSAPGFFRINDRSVSLSRVEGSNEFDRVDIRNPQSGIYEMACDHLGTQLVDVEQLKKPLEACDLVAVMAQLSGNTELLVTDSDKKADVMATIQMFLDEPYDATTAEPMVDSKSFWAPDAIREIARAKAAQTTPMYEARYLAELKKGRQPGFLKIYKDKPDYESFVRNPQNWPQMAKDGGQLHEERSAREIGERLVKLYDKKVPLPEVEAALERLRDEHIQSIVVMSQRNHERALANREELQQILQSADQPGPLKMTMRVYQLLYTDFLLDLDPGVTTAPKLQLKVDSAAGHISASPYIVTSLGGEAITWMDGVAPLASLNISEAEIKAIADWQINSRSGATDWSQVPISAEAKAALCRSLKARF